MEFQIHKNGNELKINGIIKKISEAESVIEALKEIDSPRIYIKIEESFGLPSSIIGYLVKLNDEGKKIFLEVKSQVLYELLEDLNLINLFNVKKI